MNLKIKLVGLLLLLSNTMYAQTNTSFEFSLQQAIDYEVQSKIEIWESGGVVHQENKLFNEEIKDSKKKLERVFNCF
jgi:Asp-tRNA(Asn)/Glu-tRNA(Gln) amidotransferase B subunit